jgi:ABC-type multidrug transport system ATPase subunit
MGREDTNIIETKNLHFVFQREKMLLTGINLKIPKGAIYGFLGPNGAGKTTMMKLLLGLLKPAAGSIQLFGKNSNKENVMVFSKIGALIEQPSLFEHLSGFDNLDITRRLKGLKKESIPKTLKTVELTAAAHKKVKAYSLGMKQRLGIALALLGDPELLILDEPVNGLDPAGMVEIRDLMIKINREKGTTIFISSHLLSEIEKIVSDISMLSTGQIVFTGTIQDLENKRTSQAKILIKTADDAKASQLLAAQYEVKKNESNLLVTIASKIQVGDVVRELVNSHIDVYEVSPENNFEALFLNLTKNSSPQ